MSAQTPLVLGADVGGTKTKMAIASFASGSPMLVKRETYPSRDYRALELIVDEFMRDVPAIGGACFAVAGPVEDGRAQLTNLPWQLEEAALSGHLGVSARLINDFAAAGRGIEHLAEADLMTLQPGVPVARGERVVVGAGTGLGVGVLTWSNEGYCVYPSEAGHIDFAPVDALQDELLRYLRAQFGHVSSERVLSGPGIPRLLAFLQESGAGSPTPALVEAMQRGDPAGAIAEFALGQRDELAVQALDLFACAYGAFAGNMALVTLAHGGVYVSGGIAPKIASKLTDGTFMRAFRAKGRFEELLGAIPVHVVMNEHVGLYGALAEAERVALSSRTL